MAKKIVGVYQSQVDVEKKFEELLANGASEEDIYIIIDGQENNAPESDLPIMDLSTKNKDKSLWGGIRKLFILYPDKDLLEEKMIGHGLSANDASSYANDVLNGSYLLTVEEHAVQ
ncbi:general stress protein [Metabacillus lacus]|nr:general stress protein [Metabacillus lacus]